MTTGLSGSGTPGAPWLIETRDQFSAVVRDAVSAGYYRVVADLWGTSALPLPLVVNTTANAYAAKRIDLNGYGIRLSGVGTSTASCALAGLHLSNGRLEFGYISPDSATKMTMLYRCSLEDIACYSRVSGTSSSGVYFVNSDAVPVGLSGILKRVVFLSGFNPLSVIPGAFTNITSALTVTQAYAYAPTTTGWVSAGIVQLSEPTLVAMDAVTSGAFSAAGWWQDGAYPLAYQVDNLQLTLLTQVSGVAASRVVWQERDRVWLRLGETDAAGAGQFVMRVRKYAIYAIAAMEDYDVAELRVDKVVVQSGWYLPPADNGFVYQAGSGGRIDSLAGVVFADQPVTINGIVFTPRASGPPVVRTGLSVGRYGLEPALTLDTSAGGGPIIDGDPAYLDGVVEEVHPLLGTVRALANAEVFAFERRGEEFVPMGRAFSNDVGEFRVGTGVYGGGDIFAFAADFPGVLWQPGIELGIGSRIRPTVNNGYVYEIITAGHSGATEPTWWADAGDGTEGAIGGATAKARPYYQPVGHGPLKMTLVE